MFAICLTGHFKKGIFGVHKELWQQLIRLDRQKTSQRAKCQYQCDRDSFSITLLNCQYVVDLAERQICSVACGSVLTPAGFIEQLCILAYLIGSKELPLAKRLIKAESLPGGEFFFRGPHVLPIRKLAESFGANPGLLCEAGMSFGAKKCNFGDASIELSVLPRIPLTFVVWGSDSEFKARGSILFDQSASEQLPLDALQATVNLALDALINSIDGGC